MIKFTLQNYNEFKHWTRWHDYCAFSLNEFQLLLVRRYDWMDKEESTLFIQFFGFTIYKLTWGWK